MLALGFCQGALDFLGDVLGELAFVHAGGGLDVDIPDVEAVIDALFPTAGGIQALVEAVHGVAAQPGEDPRRRVDVEHAGEPALHVAGHADDFVFQRGELARQATDQAIDDEAA